MSTLVHLVCTADDALRLGELAEVATHHSIHLTAKPVDAVASAPSTASNGCWSLNDLVRKYT